MHALRRRLSYANVVATIALFLSLTGGAMAGAKYLQATDPITQGDLAGSTYAAPVIADGKITSAKFDPAATAPNAAHLDGLDVTTTTQSVPGPVAAGGTATAVVDCPSDRVPIHVISIDAGPDIHVTGELWSGLQRHSDLQIELANDGAQSETFTSATFACFGADS